MSAGLQCNVLRQLISENASTWTINLTVNTLSELPPDGVDRQATKIACVDHSALEDASERTLGHRFLSDATELCAFSKQWLAERCVLESEKDFVLSGGYLLPAYIIESIVSKQSAIGHSHGEEEAGVVVKETFVLFCSGPKAGGMIIIISPVASQSSSGVRVNAYTMLSGSRLFFTQR